MDKDVFFEYPPNLVVSGVLFTLLECMMYYLACFQSQPYSMVKQSQERLTGNEAFEGFAIDLIAEISEILSRHTTAASRREIFIKIFCVQSLTTLSSGLMTELMGL